MTSRLDRLRDGVARFATQVAERRAEQLAKQEAVAGVRSRGGPDGAGGPGAAPPDGARARPPAAKEPPAPASAVPWGVRVAAEAGWRLLVLAGVVWVLMRVVSSIGLVVVAFCAALLITALLQPTVARLRRVGIGQGLATAIVFITGFVLMGLIGWFVVWQVMVNLPTLTTQVQDGIDELKRWAINGPFHVSERQINDIAQNLSTWLGDNSKEVTSAGLEGVTVLLEFLSGMVLTMFCTLFLLYDGERIWHWTLKFAPAAARGGLVGAGPRVWATLTGYVRGTVIVALIDAIFIGVGLYFLDVPMAVPLAVFIFLFAFVPIVGAVVSGALAVLVAIVTNGVFTALLVLAVVLAVQQIEGHILQPFILGRLVRVHPLGVVLSVTGGSLMAGIPGAVVAVPLVAVLNTGVGYLRRYGREGEAAAPAVPPGPPGAGPAPGPAHAEPAAPSTEAADAAPVGATMPAPAAPSAPGGPAGAGGAPGPAGAAAPGSAAPPAQGQATGGYPMPPAQPPGGYPPPPAQPPGAAPPASPGPAAPGA